MLAQSDFTIGESERLLAPLGVTASYLSPTATGLAKCILDATEGVRSCLRDSGLHDFSSQPQGQNHKRVIDAEVFARGTRVHTTVSLYRPETKKGDARLWISGLGSLAHAHNLLALVPARGCLLVLNVSDAKTRALLGQRDSDLHDRLARLNEGMPQSAHAVLDALRAIGAKGWIDGFRTGSTAVGMTLERELGISPNSAQAPDYLGFEVKAKVVMRNPHRGNHVPTRFTLFALVPDWDISVAKSSREIVARYGYAGGSSVIRRRLYCTVSAAAANRQGLQFRVDEGSGQLVEYCADGVCAGAEVARWRRERLESKFNEKHRQTAWVFANTLLSGRTRRFKYVSARLTWRPRTAALMNLIRSGIVTMDHLIKEKDTGSVTEKGPLFKIDPADFGLLFPHATTEVLA
jgi:hypothetical protein